MSKSRVFLATNSLINGLLRERLEGPDAEVVGEIPDGEPVPSDLDPKEHWWSQLERQLADLAAPPDIVFLPSTGADAVGLSRRLLDVCPTVVVYVTPSMDPTGADGLIMHRRSTQVHQVTVRTWDDVLTWVRWAGLDNG